MKKYFLLVVFFILVALSIYGCDTTTEVNAGGKVDSVAYTARKSISINQPNDQLQNGKLSLSINILGAEGEVVKKLDDVLFVLENTIANGVDGEVLWEPIIDGDNKNVKWGPGLNVVKADGVTTIECIKNSGNFFFSKIPFDMSKDIALVLKVEDYVSGETTETMQPGWEVSGALTSLDSENDQKTVNFVTPRASEYTGSYFYYLSDMMEKHFSVIPRDSSVTDNTVGVRLSINSTGTICRFSDYRLVQKDKGYQYSDNTATITETGENSIISVLEYPNGIKVEVEDSVTSPTTVTRKLSLVSNGIYAIAGKINDGFVYDGVNNAVILESDSYKCVISTRKKQSIEFYESEDDMLCRNSQSEPTEATKFWVIPFSSYENSDVYVAVTAGTDINTEELIFYAEEALANLYNK